MAPSMFSPYGHMKPPLLHALSLKRKKASTAAVAASAIVRAFTSPRGKQVLMRQSLKYRKMFHSGTGLVKERMPGDEIGEEKGWVTDGEAEGMSDVEDMDEVRFEEREWPIEEPVHQEKDVLLEQSLPEKDILLEQSIPEAETLVMEANHPSTAYSAHEESALEANTEAETTVEKNVTETSTSDDITPELSSETESAPESIKTEPAPLIEIEAGVSPIQKDTGIPMTDAPVEESHHQENEPIHELPVIETASEAPVVANGTVQRAAGLSEGFCEVAIEAPSEGESVPKFVPSDKAEPESQQPEDTTSRDIGVNAPWHREEADMPPVPPTELESDISKKHTERVAEDSRSKQEAQDDANPPEEREGRLLSTPSRLLKLILPLPTDRPDTAPLALLVHPQQPLSYLERLIKSEIPHNDSSEPLRIVFHAMEVGTKDLDAPAAPATAPENTEQRSSKDTPSSDTKTIPCPDNPVEPGSDAQSLVRWSLSTEIGDFIRDASRSNSFSIEISPPTPPTKIRISVPTFNDRTHYLRFQLQNITSRISQMSALKAECDHLARRSAQKVAISGFLALIAWWALVFRLTFWTNLGWDVMEPVTYLAGLSTVVAGYIWFLYHNREVSYASVLDITVTRRQIRLYKERGFDLQAWKELVDEGRKLRSEIRKVAEEYGVVWDEDRDEVGGEKVKRVLDEQGKVNTKKEKQDGGAVEGSSVKLAGSG